MNGKRAGIRLFPKSKKPFFIPSAVLWGWMIRQTPIADTIINVSTFFNNKEDNRFIVNTPKYFIHSVHRNITKGSVSFGI